MEKIQQSKTNLLDQKIILDMQHCLPQQCRLHIQVLRTIVKYAVTTTKEETRAASPQTSEGQGKIQQKTQCFVQYFFSQINYTCSVKPQKNLDTSSIFNTGETQNYIRFSTPCNNKTPITNIPQVIPPYGSLIQATNQAELKLIPLLITNARTAHIFPHLYSGDLISIGQLSGDG